MSPTDVGKEEKLHLYFCRKAEIIRTALNCLWFHAEDQQRLIHRLEKLQFYLAFFRFSPFLVVKICVKFSPLSASINNKAWKKCLLWIGRKLREIKQKQKLSSRRQKSRRWMNFLSSLQSVWWGFIFTINNAQISPRRA